MKLLPTTLVKDFPPKLKELALKRAFDINGLQIEMALEKKVNSCFSWHASPEGHNFWSDVYNGKEFEWEEDVEVSTEEFKKREGIVEAVKPQMEEYIKEYMWQTPYFIEASEEWMGVKSAKRVAGEGVEKLPSAILIYRKEKVKRKLI